MGEVVGAGLLAHVPTIMLPERTRKELNEGKEISLVPGLHKLRRDKFETLDYDTVIVMDSHWATTVEFVVTAQDRRAGLFTSEELPRGMTRIPYDFLGDPELANAIGEEGAGVGTWMTPIDDPYLPIFYATINLWDFLGRGMTDKRWISISVCQTGDSEDFLRAGRAVKAALEKVDRKVLIIASGAMSHTFWPLREIRDHEASDPKHIFTPEAYAADMVRLDWMKQGDHRSIIDTMPEFLTYKPEARFAHYLMMMGAIGEGDVVAPGELYSEYENSVGTGQVHVWFDRPQSGWTATPVAAA